MHGAWCPIFRQLIKDASFLFHFLFLLSARCVSIVEYALHVIVGDTATTIGNPVPTVAN